MATALLGKRFLDYKDKETKNLSADKLFVDFYIDDKHYRKKLNELYVKVKKGDKEIARPVSSYEEFIREREKDHVYSEKSLNQPLVPNGKIPGTDKVNRTEPYYASFEVPEAYESTENLTITKFEGDSDKGKVEKTEVPYGMRRTRRVVESEPSKNDTFLLVKFVGSSKQEFVKKSEIFYIGGASINRIYRNGEEINFPKLKDKHLQVGNMVIDTLYTEKEYSFGKYLTFEKLNAEDLKRETYRIPVGSQDDFKAKIKAGQIKEEEYKEINGVYYIKTKEIKDDKYYTEQTHKVLTVPDPKNPGKTKEEAYYAVKIYEVNGDGNYIQLKVKGGNKAEMIDVSSVCDEAGNTIKKADIKNYVGKSLKIKTESGIILETDNLTFEQANYFYEKHYNYEPSVSTNDFMADNSYLQTKTGEFVEETKIRPIGYKFTNNQKCDVYLIKIQSADGIVDKIVKAEDFAKINKSYKVQAVYGLEGCEFDKADVIQNTTNAKNNKGKLEDCTVLKNYDKAKELKEEDLKALKETIFQKFQEAYANGQYNIDHVYVDGKRIELDERLKRYILTDEHLMKDYAADTLRYTGLGKSSIKYVSKDGKLGKFEGNTKFKFGKVVKKAYGIWAKSLVYYLGFSMTLGGMLAALAAPAVMAAAAVSIVAAPVLIPIVTGVACWFANITRRPFKDKTKFNRKKWSKDVEKELAAINENMKDTDMSLGYSKDAFLAKMARVKSDILASSKSTIGNGFQVIDGQIVVDGENVNDVMKFRKTHKKDLADLKSRKKSVEYFRKRYEKLYKPFKAEEEQGKVVNTASIRYKKAQRIKQIWLDLKSEYENQENHFNKKMASYNSEVEPKEKDKGVDGKLKRAERLEKFWIIKKFTSNEDLLTQGFTKEEIELLKKVEYNTKNDSFNFEGIIDCKFDKLDKLKTIDKPEEEKSLYQKGFDVLHKLYTVMGKQNEPKPTEYVSPIEKANKEEVKKPKVEAREEKIEAREEKVEVKEEKTDTKNPKAEEEAITKIPSIASERTKTKQEIVDENKLKELENIKSAYARYDIDPKQVNKNGTLRRSAVNLNFVLEKLRRCISLAGKEILNNDEKREIKDLKYIYKANKSLLDSFINKYPTEHNPQYMTEDKFKEINETLYKFKKVLRDVGNVIMADGKLEIH